MPEYATNMGLLLLGLFLRVILSGRSADRARGDERTGIQADERLDTDIDTDKGVGGGGTGGRRSGIAQLVELLEVAVVVVGDVMCPWLLYSAAHLGGWTTGMLVTCHVWSRLFVGVFVSLFAREYR